MPVTSPVVPMVATAVLLLVQVPPVTILLKVVPVPGQTDRVPVMVPADGEEFMVKVIVADEVPQLLVIE